MDPLRATRDRFVREAATVREVRVWTDDGVPPDTLAAVRELTFAAFGGRFDEHDWDHTFGGWRVVALEDGVPVAAAAVVPRLLVVGEVPFDAGYVEGVATRPDRDGQRLGSAVMSAVGDVVRSRFAMGALSTSRRSFYERLGWERWQGPTYVRHPDHVERTPDEDDGVLVLRFGPSAGLDLTASISCAARTGDDW